MEKETLLKLVHECRNEWERTISELGKAGLERPGVAGDWRVRDVIAHCNGWDRWQLVQLRCAFSGEQPTEEELLGGLDFPKEEGRMLSEDERNAVFYSVNKDRPLDDVIDDWRELSNMRSDWVSKATQEQLDASVGADWAQSSPGRVVRLISEVPNASNPKATSAYVSEQVVHQNEHLDQVRTWMSSA